jgi:predicted O-methyltransferase YrrM
MAGASLALPPTHARVDASPATGHARHEEAIAAFADIWAGARAIDGWLTEDQARVLYEAAAAVSQGEAIVEIGSHHGRSTVILGSAKRELTKLVAVDPYGDDRWGGGSDALMSFRANLAEYGLEQQVHHLRQFGAHAGRAWRGEPVGLLFVDGAHDYPTVHADLGAWLPHLSSEAAVVMHDAYSSPGVTAAAFRHFFGAGDFAFASSTGSLVVFTRGRQTTLACLGSSIRMLGKVPWLVRNLTIKVAIRRGWSSVPSLLGHRDTAFPY